ncbi:MAG: STAS domain-containing protein [Thiomicrorhabdus sp.]|nr:STAS domain-containing protein [Thiomicrorhabdus sp.]
MTIEVSTNNEVATIKIIGRFDFSSQREFRDAYQNQQQHISEYIVDLSQTEYIDSSALGMLLILKEYVESKNGQSKIFQPAPAIKKILSISNLDQLFTISD